MSAERDGGARGGRAWVAPALAGAVCLALGIDIGVRLAGRDADETRAATPPIAAPAPLAAPERASATPPAPAAPATPALKATANFGAGAGTDGAPLAAAPPVPAAVPAPPAGMPAPPGGVPAPPPAANRAGSPTPPGPTAARTPDAALAAARAVAEEARGAADPATVQATQLREMWLRAEGGDTAGAAALAREVLRAPTSVANAAAAEAYLRKHDARPPDGAAPSNR